ncbi:BTAD domain-containing putative transcriptional regulator [Streptomyces sp. TRM 70351]|uniref:AfsR/SARP family transcriptional regulator n=1 Tax=Streptomyces sp. TRM 70351 TaxID=3116552 RepID=UPI002E7AD24A|nr:BTAD domain-containing putative transcriptional regulator [Streptomyces sp. TRM 70351]MEE1926730.1 BTAD domain-containing putative transcriptional regulator [Streptomyces sp. TRM 70351]
MEFRILGPVVALDGRGEHLPVTAPMLRTLLAALVLHPGRPVPAEELADQLWGERLPANARTALRNYVMRLRKAVPGDRIRTVPGGYLLAAERDETDLGRFRALLLRSRERTSAAPAEAAALLREALSLWRGTPLADLTDSPLRTNERPRLEELHLTAAEERFELELALGRHALVVDELSATARRHRLRERLTRQLMLALHRCGRTAEALAAYRDARRDLVDELAIEPGPETRELERAILRADPALHAPAPAGHAASPAPGPAAAPSAGPPPGAAFPAGTAAFVARGVELARLRERLTGAPSAPAVCLIDGPGGVGKSTLAVRAAREVADRFPGGLHHVDLRGADPHRAPLETVDALHVLLGALGVSPEHIPADTGAATRLYHELLAGRRTLLVLDNAVHTRQVLPLLPAEPGSAAVVTSRAVLTGVPHAQHLHLDALTTSDAVALIKAVSGRPAEPGDQAHWEELAALCGRLPLALRIIATRLASRPRWSVADWAAVLRDERGRLDELVTADLDARASLMLSIDQLAAADDPDDQRAAALFPLLGTTAVTTYSVPAVAALGGHSPARARDALERLTDAQIASSPRPGAYSLHDLVRAAAVRQAAALPTARAHGALSGLSRWYLGSLHRLNSPLTLPESFRRRYREGAARYPEGRTFDRTDEAMAWADSVMDDVLALAGQLSEPEYDTAERPLAAFALEACRALETYFVVRLSWRAQERLCGAVLRAAERRGDDYARAIAHSQLGKAAGQRGDGERGRVHLERAIGLFRGLGDHPEELGALNNLAPCLAISGRLEEAVETARAALAEGRAGGPPEIVYSALNNLGRCQLMLGQRDEAVHLLTGAYREAPLDYHLASIASVLAECSLDSGDFEDAACWADRGIGHAAEQPFDPFQVAHLHAMLSAALRGLGRTEQASAADARARHMLDDLNSREAASLSVLLTGGEPSPGASPGTPPRG